MSDPAAQPDWSRLPHDPAGFFRLAAAHDRRELKREYAKLIRRFKPELFPTEFQRIRAAYEELEQRLRYGMRADDSATPTAPWEAAAADLPKEAKHPQTAPLASLTARLQRESPSLLYSELKGLSDKSSKDFFALALLSDIVEPDEGRFAMWLLDGIANTRDHSLAWLLYLIVRGPIQSESITRLLEACSCQLSEDAFFPVTEPLWKRLVKEADFPLFQTTLRKCENNLPGLNIGNRVIFYVQMLRSAMWIATAEWIGESMQFVEENFQFIPRELEQDVDLLVAIQAYVRVRDEFRRAGVLRETLDSALQAFFVEDQLRGDQEFIGVQLRLAESGANLLESFPDSEEPALAAFYPLWSWASYDVGERNVEPAKSFEIDTYWRGRIWKLLENASYSLGSSRAGFLWTVGDIGIKCLYVGGFLIPNVILIWLCIVYFDKGITGEAEEGSALLVYFASIGFGVGIGFGIRWFVRKYLQTPMDTRLSKTCYNKHWRREVLQLLEQSHIPAKLFAAEIGSVCSSRNSTWAWLYHYVQQDIALALFSIAQRFIA